jgi:hypothetical protein
MEFTFTVKIDAPTIEKAKEALQAMIDLKKSLQHEDLIYLANLAKRKPSFVKKAKPYESYL